jgi:hypothetical protein
MISSSHAFALVPIQSTRQSAARSRSLPQVARAHPGTVAVSADIKAAYRACLIAPEHKPWLVSSTQHPITGALEFWLDHCNPFGMASAHGILGTIADATVDILEVEARVEKDVFIDSSKWVDDFTFMQEPIGGGLMLADDSMSPRTYRFSTRAELLDLITPLRIPWHETKGQEIFRPSVDYLGFTWDFAAKSVTLPDVKRRKYLGRVLTLLVSHSATLDDVLKLHGLLMHITFIIRAGRLFLPALSSFAASFPPATNPSGRLTRRHYAPSVRHDLEWWAATLRQPVPALLLLCPRRDLDLGIWVDASTDWGIGLIWNDTRWDAWQLRPGWKGPGRHITWLECVAVELVVMLLEHHDIHDANVLIHSDNQGVIGAFCNGHALRRMRR